MHPKLKRIGHGYCIIKISGIFHPRSGSAALRQLSPIYEMGHKLVTIRVINTAQHYLADFFWGVGRGGGGVTSTLGWSVRL